MKHASITSTENNPVQRTLISFASLLLLAGATARAGTAYTFEVLYSGGGAAALAPGSDPMVGTTLLAGDSFTYDLKAVTDVWTVVANAAVFPLAGLPVSESGLRVGDFTLTLKLTGVDVFSYSEAGSEQRFVHIGTNAIFLPQGLVFDEMHLSYSLTFAETDDNNPPVPIDSTIAALLPIFGPPESAGAGQIIYGPAVPEPTSMALLFVGACGVGVVARLRRRAA